MGFHTFYVRYEKNNENVDNEVIKTELISIAKKHKFVVKDKTSMSELLVKPKEKEFAFTCDKTLTSFQHWWKGGEKGMAKDAQSLAWEIEQYLLKDEKCKINFIYLQYSSGVPDLI